MKSIFNLIMGLAALMASASTASAAAVTVTYPNGGECLTPGSQIDITWTSDGINHVAIGSKSDGTTPPTWLSSNSSWDFHPAQGYTFKWDVPSTTSNTVKLWLEGHDAGHSRVVLDSSDANFSVSDSCDTTAPSASSAPQLTQIVVDGKTYGPVDTVEIERGADITLKGTAKANQAVNIYVTSTEKKFTTTAGVSGSWQFDVWTSNLDLGAHQIDLETSDSPRAKALTFSVAEKTATESEETKVGTLPTTLGGVRESSAPFPVTEVLISLGAIIISGLAAYLLARWRHKPAAATTPAEPPKIT